VTLPEEIKGMMAKARRYLDSAEVLRQKEDHDSAISRLYYAMFYAAEALLLARGQTFSSHRAVISGLAQHLVKPGLLPKEMHQWLLEAFEKRQISDYEYLTGIGEADVLDLKDKAERFLLQAEAFLKKEGLL
jgi:uncharacterized protein (UPF0332 family)